MRQLLLCLTAFFSLTVAQGQTQFHMRYGSPYHDHAKKVIQTQDGNFVMVGYTDGFGSSGNALIMKVNSLGAILWIKDYSGINYDEIADVVELADKKLVMCGATSSYGAGQADAFLMKTDSVGNLIWARAYGDIGGEYFKRLFEDGSGGFYVAGTASDIATGNAGASVARMDGFGNILWARLVTNIDGGTMDMTPVTGGVVLAEAVSPNNHFSLWKFSPTGTLIWSNDYLPMPVFSGLLGFAILENSNAEILVTYSVNNQNTVAQSEDNFILKLNSTGGMVSNYAYGGIYYDSPTNISNTKDGGLILSGITNSAGNGGDDVSLIKIDANGTVQWGKAYGTAWTEQPTNVVQTNDDGFAFTGKTFSIGSTYDSAKVYLVKTDSLGATTCRDISWTPTKTNHSVTIGAASTPINFTFQENQINWTLNNRYFYTADICNPASVSSISTTNNLNIYPNPFSTQTTLQTAERLQSASLTIYNSVGQTVKRIDNLAGQTIIFHRDNLPSGLYFVRLTQDGNTISADKLVITD